MSVQLPPQPTSAHFARSLVANTLAGWGLEEAVDDAQLVVSELVSNGVLHARTPLDVAVSVGTSVIEISVTDRNPQQVQLRPARDDLHGDIAQVLSRRPLDAVDDRDPSLHVGEAGALTGGRGLLLLNTMGELGETPTPAGKSVWLRWPAPASWAFNSACLCAPSHPNVVTLGSGRSVVHML